MHDKQIILIDKFRCVMCRKLWYFVVAITERNLIFLTCARNFVYVLFNKNISGRLNYRPAYFVHFFLFYWTLEEGKNQNKFNDTFVEMSYRYGLNFPGTSHDDRCRYRMQRKLKHFYYLNFSFFFFSATEMQLHRKSTGHRSSQQRWKFTRTRRNENV